MNITEENQIGKHKKKTLLQSILKALQKKLTKKENPNFNDELKL